MCPLNTMSALLYFEKVLCKFESAIIAKCVFSFSSEKTINVYK